MGRHPSRTQPREKITKEPKLKAAKGAPKTVEEYIAGFPADIQRMLQMIRSTVKKAAPGAEEKISYHMPAFGLNGPLVGFAAFKHHIGLYPAPRAHEEFKDELSL